MIIICMSADGWKWIHTHFRAWKKVELLLLFSFEPTLKIEKNKELFLYVSSLVPQFIIQKIVLEQQSIFRSNVTIKSLMHLVRYYGMNKTKKKTMISAFVCQIKMRNGFPLLLCFVLRPKCHQVYFARNIHFLRKASSALWPNPYPFCPVCPP